MAIRNIAVPFLAQALMAVKVVALIQWLLKKKMNKPGGRIVNKRSEGQLTLMAHINPESKVAGKIKEGKISGEN